MGFFLVRRQVAAVVGGALLVAERLETILQVALERLIEFLRLHPQRFFVGVFAAADDALAQREQKLPHAFRAVLRLDELVDRVSEVVRDEPRIRGVPVPLGLAHLGHEIGDGGVANHHQIDRIPLAALELGAAFVDPQRHALPDQPLRDDVELELMGEFVRDEAVEIVRRIIDRQQHPLAIRLGKRRHAFLGGARARRFPARTRCAS